MAFENEIMDYVEVENSCETANRKFNWKSIL